ncbi:MAG: hypothetical protein GY883_03165 [Shimia sp.]|nr:hypothetical protein [Shimia sp.]
MRPLVITAVLGLLASPVASQAILGQNSPTADVGGGAFAVVNKWSARDDDIWCAAAKGALRRGAAWQDRLYVIGVTGARQSQFGAETITFTFRPNQEQLAQARKGSSSIRGIGNNLTVNSANRRCQREPDYW